MLNWMLRSRVAHFTPKSRAKCYRSIQGDRFYSNQYDRHRASEEKSTRFFAGMSFGILTLALVIGKLKGSKELSFVRTEAEARLNNSFCSELKSGHKEKLTVFLLYDSRVATQRESLSNMLRDSVAEWLVSNKSNKNLNVVKVDVSKEQLPDTFPYSAAKVS